jgi:putative glycosyltransferase (TIGR04372 family)
MRRPINQRFLAFELRRILGMSKATITQKIALKLATFTFGILLTPIAFFFHILGYRYVNIFSDRIGHLAIEPDCLLKEQKLLLIPARKWILLAPPNRIANEHLLTYWEPEFKVIRSSAYCFLIKSMAYFGLMLHDVSSYARVQNGAQKSYQVFSQWGARPPLLKLNNSDLVWRKLAFNKLGLPEDAWFVCVHAREGGYSPIDESIQSYRNSSIENYLPAIRYITSRGGWVLRIGDKSMKSIPDMENVIDYAHHPFKSDRLDIILSASCKFMLGSTSGISLVSNIFGVPVAVANLAPSADLWYGAKDISIPKRIWSHDLHKYLSLEESLEYPHGCYRYTDDFIASGLELTENEPDDILELTKEMMFRLSNAEFELQEDTLSKSLYNSKFDKRYPSRYSCSHLGASFYNKYFALAKKI